MNQAAALVIRKRAFKDAHIDVQIAPPQDNSILVAPLSEEVVPVQPLGYLSIAQ